ncbi:MAG: hypothetical protein IPP07_28715 [Holophagales bacterium]|nr:hypothetical protein [Holophagales bacterium]
MVGNDWTKKRLFGPFGTSSPEDTGEEFANMSSGVSAPKPLTPRTAQAMTPQASPQYTGQEQAHAEAIDDGKQAPIAASRYLSYKDDPTWKAHDAQSNDALSGSGGFGAAILDRLTHGYYSSSKANQFQMATAKKNEIEKRYYNQSVLDEAAREKFDTQPSEKKVWDAENRRFNDVYVGTHGTRRQVQTSAPTDDVITQFGTKETVQRIPGATPMIVDPTKAFGGSEGEDLDIPGFRGGQSEVYRPMAQLGMDPKMSADVKEKTSAAAENDADTQKALADAGKSRVDAMRLRADADKTIAEIPFVGQREISPGASLMTGTGKTLGTAKLTPSQIDGGSGGSSGRPLSTQDAERLAVSYANGLVGASDLTKLSPDATAIWKRAHDERLNELTGKAPAPAASAPATRFPAGKTTKVTLEDLQ